MVLLDTAFRASASMAAELSLETQADTFKQQGNGHFKAGRYADAIAAYTRVSGLLLSATLPCTESKNFAMHRA